MSDVARIVLVAAAWAGGVGLAGLALAWLLRRASLRWLPVGAALVGVGAVVGAVVGTARAMFLSEHDYRVVLWVCLVAAVVTVLLSAVVGSAVARWSQRLREGVEELGRSGSYDAHVGGPAEFTALSEQLRDSSLHLADSRARERRLEESRRELVSWVSHDLRTPLAGLRAMAEALEDGMVDDPARYHRRIVAEVDRTVRMVDDLFELSRIHAGLLEPALEIVALDDLVAESFLTAEPVARAKGVHLTGEVDPDLRLRADPAAMSRVVGNLLMNAIRHTPADGTVTLTARQGSDAVELGVLDGCGGIPADEIDRVFEVAFRGGHARTPTPSSSSGSGAGLGLAIVRGLVEAHRGRVDVSNVADGCRFVVRLPAGPSRTAG